MCGVLCEDGLEPMGAFRCTFGEYGQEPVCMLPSTAYRAEPSVKTRLLASVSLTDAGRAAFNTTDTQVSGLENDEVFLGNVEKAISEASNRSLEDVTLLEANGLALVNETRRLQAGEELKILFKVRMTDNEEADALKADMTAVGGYFARQLVQKLQELDNRFEVDELRLEQPWTVYVWRFEEHKAVELTRTDSQAGTIAGIAVGVLMGVSCICAVAIGMARRHGHHHVDPEDEKGRHSTLARLASRRSAGSNPRSSDAFGANRSSGAFARNSATFTESRSNLEDFSASKNPLDVPSAV